MMASDDGIWSHYGVAHNSRARWAQQPVSLLNVSTSDSMPPLSSSTSSFDESSDPEGSGPEGSGSALTAAEETRAAIDVMFEALAHIQASMETESEDAREQAYYGFKEALQHRLHHVIQQRTQDKVTAAEEASGKEVSGVPPAKEASVGPDVKDTAGSGSEAPPHPDALDVSGDGAPADDFGPSAAEDESTLEKFWPAIAQSTGSDTTSTGSE